MFYSKSLNLLLIGIPKTGSRSVEKTLFTLDSEGESHSIRIGEKVLKGSSFKQGILGHARAKEILEIVGSDFYYSLNTIAFIRDPLDKLVSSYHFNKQNTWKIRKFKGEKKLYFRKLKYLATTTIAKILPFYFWAFIYPYKSNLDYIYDSDGVRLVKYIGRTKYLQSDLKKILDICGVDTSQLIVAHVNKSKHDSFEKYYSNPFFKKLIQIKLKKDIQFYNIINEELNNEIQLST